MTQCSSLAIVNSFVIHTICNAYVVCISKITVLHVNYSVPISCVQTCGQKLGLSSGIWKTWLTTPTVSRLEIDSNVNCGVSHTEKHHCLSLSIISIYYLVFILTLDIPINSQCCSQLRICLSARNILTCS